MGKCIEFVYRDYVYHWSYSDTPKIKKTDGGKMKVKSIVRQMGKKRKVVEIPKPVRHHFKNKEEVEISKVKKK